MYDFDYTTPIRCVTDAWVCTGIDWIPAIKVGMLKQQSRSSNPAGSDLRQVRDLGVRQLDEVEGAQFDAEASAPA